MQQTLNTGLQLLLVFGWLYSVEKSPACIKFAKLQGPDPDGALWFRDVAEVTGLRSVTAVLLVNRSNARS